MLNTNIIALGSLYNPSNQALKLTNLQALYPTAFNQKEDANNLVAPYSIAVDQRQAIFKPLNRQLTKLRTAYKATQGITQVELEDFMTIARKLKGESKTPKMKSTDPATVQNTHSTSQMS